MPDPSATGRDAPASPIPPSPVFAELDPPYPTIVPNAGLREQLGLGSLPDSIVLLDIVSVADIRTLMARLLGPVHPSDAETEAAFRRLYETLPSLAAS